MPPSSWALAHFLRDPLEVCVSGYQYHLNSTEPWVLEPRDELGGLSWREYFASVGVAEGLVTECVRGLPEVRDQAEVYVSARDDPRVHSFRLESVATNFTAQVLRLFDIALPSLGLDGAIHPDRLVRSVAKFDLSEHAPMGDKASHVSDANDKVRLREFLWNAPGKLPAVLQDLRVLLGYDTDAPAAGRATTRSSAPEPARVFEAVKEISREFWSGFRSRGRNFLGRGLETI